MSVAPVHPESFDSDTAAPDAARAAARFAELAHYAMAAATFMLRSDQDLTEEENDLAWFALFASDVIRGEGIGMNMPDVVAAFRAIGTAERSKP